jgi:hypothetical protein
MLLPFLQDGSHTDASNQYHIEWLIPVVLRCYTSINGKRSKSRITSYLLAFSVPAVKETRSVML